LVSDRALVESFCDGHTPGVKVSQRLCCGVAPLRCEVVVSAQRVSQQVLDAVGDDELEKATGVVVFPFVQGGVVAGRGGLVAA
jgi:hypothetical protein